jgi:hypothetical protein
LKTTGAGFMPFEFVDLELLIFDSKGYI